MAIGRPARVKLLSRQLELKGISEQISVRVMRV